MQLCRPHVAQGVNDHSQFREYPLKRAINTLVALRAIVFSPTSDANAVLDRLRKKHDGFAGTIKAETSSYHAGGHYDAGDQTSKLWVMASLADTVYSMYAQLFGPLPAADAEMLWRDWRKFGSLFHVADDIMPRTYVEFRRYMDDMVDGTGGKQHELVVDGNTVHQLSEVLFTNVVAILTASRALTWGLLPIKIRHLAIQRRKWLISIRHRIVLAIVRALAKHFGGERSYDRQYLKMLKRAGSSMPGLDQWERAYSKRDEHR